MIRTRPRVGGPFGVYLVNWFGVTLAHQTGPICCQASDHECEKSTSWWRGVRVPLGSESEKGSVVAPQVGRGKVASYVCPAFLRGGNRN